MIRKMAAEEETMDELARGATRGDFLKSAGLGAAGMLAAGGLADLLQAESAVAAARAAIDSPIQRIGKLSKDRVAQPIPVRGGVMQGG